MRIALDYDGVISANWQFYHQFALTFGLSNHSIYVLTAAGKIRQDMIRRLLEINNIFFDEIITRPDDFISNPYNIGEWKKDMIKKYKVDLWFDNEIKQYEQAGVDFSDLKTAIVRI